MAKTIFDITRERATSGAYGAAKLRMSRTTVQRLAELYRPDAPPVLGSIPTLIGIPILVDERLADGAWRLEDWHSTTTLHEGTLEQEPRIGEHTAR